MKDFINRMEHAMYKTGKAVSEKAKTISEIAKIRFEIISRENSIKDKYTALGQKVYDNKEEFSDKLGKETAEIDTLYEEIKGFQKELEGVTIKDE